jgi:hypothetical protein
MSLTKRVLDKPLERLEDNLLQFASTRQYEIQDVTFTDADEDVDVVHGLRVADPYRVRYQVLQSTAPVTLYHHPDSEWGPKLLKLRSTGGNTVVRVLLTVDENDAAPLERSTLPEVKLQGDYGRAHSSTYFTDSANAFDGVSGPGMRLSDVLYLGGNSTIGADWFMVGAYGTFPVLNFTDNARLYTPLQIRWDNVNGDYYVQPGNLTGAAVEVFLGRVDHATQGRFKGGGFLAGVATYGRTTYDGVWTSVAYAAGNFTASSGNWTVDAGDQTTFSYMLVGKTMTVAFWIVSTDVSATPATLQIPIPGGYTAAKNMRTMISATDAGTSDIGMAQVLAGGTTIYFYKDKTGANWTTTAADNTNVLGMITFEIQ